LHGLRGRSRGRLLQALDNATNERFGHARRVKLFGKYSFLATKSEIVINKLFSL